MQDTRQTDLDPLDRIDRSIDIDASAERVWELVSRPGWWINEGAVDPEPDLVLTGDDAVLRHPSYGEFRLRVLESRPPSYVSYRWTNPDADAGTLVEFWIEPRDERRHPAGGRERLLRPRQGARGLAEAPRGQRGGLEESSSRRRAPGSNGRATRREHGTDRRVRRPRG